MSIVLGHADASVVIDEKHGRRAIRVIHTTPRRQSMYECVTDYPVELINHVLQVKGPGHLCDEIMRDECSRYVEHHVRWDILGFKESADFSGRRVMDFGSGSGASSVVLARMIPDASIVGVELRRESVELARHRARYRGVDGRVSFQQSPSADTLPEDIGVFDYIVCSAVYEHLLPGERQRILPLLWSHLKQGGVMFVNQTPHRWLPIEMHTTGLPLLNYLPDIVALHYARLCSARVSRLESWSELLRRGIRGGVSSEILGILRKVGEPVLLRPLPPIRDDIDLWCHLSSAVRMPGAKKLLAQVVRFVRVVTGATVVPMLSLAIKKTR